MPTKASNCCCKECAEMCGVLNKLLQYNVGQWLRRDLIAVSKSLVRKNGDKTIPIYEVHCRACDRADYGAEPAVDVYGITGRGCEFGEKNYEPVRICDPALCSMRSVIENRPQGVLISLSERNTNGRSPLICRFTGLPCHNKREVRNALCSSKEYAPNKTTQVTVHARDRRT